MYKVQVQQTNVIGIMFYNRMWPIPVERRQHTRCSSNKRSSYSSSKQAFADLLSTDCNSKTTSYSLLMLSEWEPSARAAGNWTNHSNRFTGLIKPLNRIDSKEWIICEWASLIDQRNVDSAFGINWSSFNLYCIKIK